MLLEVVGGSVSGEVLGDVIVPRAKPSPCSLSVRPGELQIPTRSRDFKTLEAIG